MKIKRGDIVWLDSSIQVNLGKSVQSLNRPYAVISNDTNNEKCPTINLACLSCNIEKSHYPMHVAISKEKYSLDGDSVIFVEQVMTVNKAKVTRIVSSLDKEDLKRLNKAIYVQLINEKEAVNF